MIAGTCTSTPSDQVTMIVSFEKRRANAVAVDVESELALKGGRLMPKDSGENEERPSVSVTKNEKREGGSVQGRYSRLGP